MMCSLVLSARLPYLVSFDNIARSTYMVFFLALARYCALFLSSLKARLYCLVFSNVQWLALDAGFLLTSGSLTKHGLLSLSTRFPTLDYSDVLAR